MYLQSLKDYSDEPIALQQGIICAAFEEWEDLSDLPSKLIQQKMEFEEVYKKFLPSGKDEVKSHLKCFEKKDGEVRCYIPASVNKYVRMKFKEE